MGVGEPDVDPEDRHLGEEPDEDGEGYPASYGAPDNAGEGGDLEAPGDPEAAQDARQEYHCAYMGPHEVHHADALLLAVAVVVDERPAGYEHQLVEQVELYEVGRKDCSEHAHGVEEIEGVVGGVGRVRCRDACFVLLLLEPVLHVGGRVDADHEGQDVYRYQHPYAQAVSQQAECEARGGSPSIALAIGSTAVYTGGDVDNQ